MRLSSPAALFAIAACLAVGCGDTREHKLFLNLFPSAIPDQDPFLGIHSLRIEPHDGEGWQVDSQGYRWQPGRIPAGDPCRMCLSGLDDEGTRLAWGFSPPLDLSRGPRKASIFFTLADSAVAHAAPPLIDPQDGLLPIGIPIGLDIGSATIFTAYNTHHLYLHLKVQDDNLVANEGDPFSGDLVVVVIDGHADSEPESRGFDDLAIAFGAAQYVEIFNPLSQADPIIHNFKPSEDGYSVFAAIPIGPLTGSDSPGPEKIMGLGIELRNLDDETDPEVTRWPSGWNPNPDGSPPESYFAYGTGSLALKTRLLDAMRVERHAVDFGPGIDDFIHSGGVPLTRAPAPNEDSVDVYALWDSTALMLAIDSGDDVFCAQERASDDRESILRDDAIEVVLAMEDGRSYRALFNLLGSTTYDKLEGGQWAPSELYFRIDMDGERPENDCRSGSGYTFKIRIPWNELGYESQPPELNDLFAFDIVVYDNDRGARSVSAFSPMGPTEVTEEFGELRLFEY